MKKTLSIALVAMLMAVSGCGISVDDILMNQTDSEEEAAAADAETTDESGIDDLVDGDTQSESEENLCCVYICGEVNNPGVYELAEGSRLYELVDLAGGMTANACEDGINLAEEIEDGEMITVPSIDGADSAQQSGTDGTDSDGRINLNTATVDQLMTLSGIGQSRAEEIVAYRDQHGTFSDISQITEVSGIGSGIYDKIKDNITVQ